MHNAIVIHMCCLLKRNWNHQQCTHIGQMNNDLVYANVMNKKPFKKSAQTARTHAHKMPSFLYDIGFFVRVLMDKKCKQKSCRIGKNRQQRKKRWERKWERGDHVKKVIALKSTLNIERTWSKIEHLAGSRWESDLHNTFWAARHLTITYTHCVSPIYDP